MHLPVASRSVRWGRPEKRSSLGGFPLLPLIPLAKSSWWSGMETTLLTGSLRSTVSESTGATGSEVVLDDFQISQTGPDFLAELDAFEASVVYNSDQNEYLVIWSSEGTTFENEFEIFGQRIHGSAGSEIGRNDFRISDMGPDFFDPRFGAFTSAVAYSGRKR